MASGDDKMMADIRPSVSRSSSAPLFPPQTMPQQQTFMFLDSTTEELSAERKRSARSFVMQKARREKPWSTRRQGSPKLQESPKTKRAGSPSATPRDTPRNSKDKTAKSSQPSPKAQAPRNRSMSLASDQTTSSKADSRCKGCTGVCQSGTDFCTSCIELSMTASGSMDMLMASERLSSSPPSYTEDELLSYWLDHICAEYIDIDIYQKCTALRDDCLRLLHERAAIQAVLCFAAQSLAIQGKASVENVIFYKGQAIAEINNSLSDAAGSVSDSNIFAVFVLLCLEERCYKLTSSPAEMLQEVQQREVHLKGLRHMLAVRGGIGALTTNPTLQALLAWHAVADSLLTLSQPWLDLEDWRLCSLYPRIKIFATDVRTSTLRQLLESSTILQRPLANIANDVCDYVAELHQWYQSAPSHVDPMKLQSWGVALQSRLHDCLPDPSQVIGRRASEECVCLALLAFVTKITMTRDRGFDPIQIAILGRLKEALLRSTGQDWSSMPLALFWILSVGGICSINSVEESWFATHFRGACQLFSIWTLDEAKSHVSQLFWMDARLDESLKIFWGRSNQEIVYEQLAWNIFIGMDSLQLSNLVEMTSASEMSAGAATIQTAIDPPGHRIVPAVDKIYESPNFGIIPDRGAVLGYAFGHSIAKNTPCPLCYDTGTA